MKSKFTLTESERDRVLGLHKSAIKKEFLTERDAVLGNQGTPVVGATPGGASIANTATQTPPTNPTTPTTSATTPTSETKVLNDRDYSYKKEGDKYFFKLQTNPASDSAKKLKAANKYVNWTEAKTDPALSAIKALKWGQSEKMAMAPASNIKLQNTNTPTQLAGVNPTTGTTTGTTTATTTGTTPTSTTQAPEVVADLKTASEIRQQFRQGRRDQRQIQRQYDKMTNTYNRLAVKMDKNTKDQYIAAMNALKQQLGQA